MNRKMQALALAGKCCGRGASGPALVEGCSFASSALKATVPSVAPSPYRKSRRLGSEKGCMGVTPSGRSLRETGHNENQTVNAPMNLSVAQAFTGLCKCQLLRVVQQQPS